MGLKLEWCYAIDTKDRAVIGTPVLKVKPKSEEGRFAVGSVLVNGLKCPAIYTAPMDELNYA